VCKFRAYVFIEVHVRCSLRVACPHVPQRDAEGENAPSRSFSALALPHTPSTPTSRRLLFRHPRRKHPRWSRCCHAHSAWQRSLRPLCASRGTTARTRCCCSSRGLAPCSWGKHPPPSPWAQAPWTPVTRTRVPLLGRRRRGCRARGPWMWTNPCRWCLHPRRRTYLLPWAVRGTQTPSRGALLLWRRLLHRGARCPCPRPCLLLPVRCTEPRDAATSATRCRFRLCPCTPRSSGGSTVRRQAVAR